MKFSKSLAALFAISLTFPALAQVTIDHRFSNTDAQSLIGLPMGSHKTIVDKKGNLKWSQWSLKRKPLDTPIGFSMQMDGELAIEAFAGAAPLAVTSQTLYNGRYPFIVTKLVSANLSLEELAFSVDPDSKPGTIPDRNSGTHGLDVVRLTFTNSSPTQQEATLKLSGKERNLPGHVTGSTLITGAGEDVALLTETAGATPTPEDNGLTLAVHLTIPSNSSKTIALRLPYEWQAKRNAELSTLTVDQLLTKAVAQWDDLWSHGTHLEFPQKDLTDFYYSSIAYVLILTEYDAAGDLWTLDGPAVYRQYWGRGEYFQARALEVAGFFSPARESVEHAFHIINDDGEWDGPPTSGWPAWDNAGGNAAAVWDYYLYSGDKAWLAKAYPYLLHASEWIKAHREESTLEEVKGVPTGAIPIKRLLTGAKCRTIPDPPLAPGEKSYSYGLLPWSYGDSGLPEGHSYSHNFLAAYAVDVTSKAARALGYRDDAAWLDKEYAAYTADIRESVRRAVTLEKIPTPYLPAMPTYPEGAYSQTFLAVYPTQLYSAQDPLVSGLIARMEKEEQQGVPTNVAWAGPAGVWAGEAMNMAETYLLRGEKQKAADMTIAAMNHSYTTNVFKEEILVDADAPRACDTPHSKRANGEGTGDMPEAWGNANAVLILRDMLVNEREGTLHILPGLLASWVPVGKTLTLDDAPVTTGRAISVRVDHPTAAKWTITIDPQSKIRNFIVHIPVDSPSEITVGGKKVAITPEIPVIAGKSVVIEVVK